MRVVRSLALDAGCSHGGGGAQSRLEMGTLRPFGALWGLQMRKGGSARSADSTGDSARLCQASLQEPVPALRDVRKAFGRHQAVCHSKLVHVLRSRL